MQSFFLFVHKHHVKLFLLLILSLFTPVEVKAQNPIPKYKFLLGSELTFQGREVFKTKGQQSDSSVVWKVIAAKQTFGGAWRLVFAFGNIDDPNWLQTEKGIRWAYADVMTTGNFVPKPADSNWINPSVCFPKLPELPGQLKKGWGSVNVDSVNTFFERLPKKPNEAEWFKFHGTTSRTLDPLYDAQSESWYEFNIATGFVDKIESSMKRSVYENGEATEQTGRGLTELIATRQLDAKWIRNFAYDQKLYFNAMNFWKSALLQAQREPKNGTSILRNASQQLMNIRKSIKTPSFVHNLQEITNNERYYINLAKSQADKRSVWIGKPAPGWEVKLEAGKRRTLTEFRGRVTILEFWHSGSDLCIEELALLKEIQKKYLQYSPQIIGMNVDENPQDADFVINRLNLGFEQLPAKNVAKKYNISKFPTTLVLNPHGVVIDYIEGGIKKERNDFYYVLDKEFRLLK